MSENFDNKMRGIYGWKVEDGKAIPPVHRFPKAVKERLDYFAEMMEDGLSMRGCLECVFSETEPDGYWLGATKDWLPQDDIFKKWVGTTESVAWTEAVIYLLYGNWTDVPDGQAELELAENKPILDYGQEFNELAKNVKGFAEQYGIDVNRDEFCLIQPYDEGHSIIMRPEEFIKRLEPERLDQDGAIGIPVDGFDNVTKPKHYQGKHGLEAMNVIDNFIGDLVGKQAYCWGNVVKYLLRFQQKNGLEDLKKARQHLDWLIEEVE